jgi:DNA invertase Pin-like site-specific DNA recombinase
MNKGLVYSYMRFSDPKQAAGDSRTRQMTYAVKWAADHGLPLDENLSMQDEGLSAYHQHHVKRGALGAFLAAVEAEVVPRGSFLIVEGLDRLSRAEPILAQAQLAQIINAGISVVTASDGKVYSRETLKANPMDLVYSLLVMIRAHEESETKSSRVKAAIRRQCEAWQAGTFRGHIRNGTDPSWLKWNGQGWEFIEERVAALRSVLEWYRAGMGSTRIVRELRDRNLSVTGRPPNTLGIFRLIRLRPLMGDRELEVDGQTYTLEGYYPPVLTRAEWLEIQELADRRGLRPMRATTPNIITGIGIAKCGYCGTKMVGVNMMERRRKDGTLPDFARRLMCYRNSRYKDCSLGVSGSVVPLEKALLSYCSDMMNLQALQGADRSAGPKAKLASASAELASIEQKLQRLVTAMLESDDVPTAFVKRAHELEVDKGKAQAAVSQAEQEVAAASRTDVPEADKKWRDLAAGVLQLDEADRLQARRLVSDTFEDIRIWLRGIDPDETAEGMVDVRLTAKGGASRLLRVSPDGRWHAGEDLPTVAEIPAD